KNGWMRIPKGFLDLLTVKFLTGFGQRPQHLLGAVGLTGFAVGAIGMLILTAWWFISRTVPGLEPVNLHQRAIFYYSLAAVILGAQFMSVGFLAEMFTALDSCRGDSYAIAEVAGSGRRRRSS